MLKNYTSGFSYENRHYDGRQNFQIEIHIDNDNLKLLSGSRILALN